MNFLSLLFLLTLLPRAHAKLNIEPLARLIRARTCLKELVQGSRGDVLVIVGMGSFGSDLVSRMARDLRSQSYQSFSIPPVDSGGEKLIFLHPPFDLDESARIVATLAWKAKLRPEQIVVVQDDPRLKPNQVGLAFNPRGTDRYAHLRVGIGESLYSLRGISGLLLLAQKLQQRLNANAKSLPRLEERMQEILFELNN